MSDAVYTASEAAAVIGAPLKDVNNLIYKGMLPDAALLEDNGKRLLRVGLVSLKAAYATTDLLTTEQRRKFVRKVYESPRTRTVRLGIMSLDVGRLAEETRRGVERLDRARRMVVKDRAILGGTPVFRGTRIPVHDVAAMLANGDTWQVLRKVYPRLSRKQIELAPIYAKAYPRRGRPRQRKDLERLVLTSSDRIHLKDLQEAPREILDR